MNKPHRSTRRERQMKSILSFKLQHDTVPLLKKQRTYVRKVKRSTPPSSTESYASPS